MPRHALLLGATGLVGREILRLLLGDAAVERVTVIARRPTGNAHTKLDERILDLGEMQQHPDAFAADAIFCALGTTIKTAGSQDRFRVVDYDYPLMAARLGKQQGAQHYLLVSALGANAGSRVFYNRVKGEVERDLLALNYPRTTIARPSLLLGEREEFRLGERVFERLGWLVPPAYKPIHARDVAAALVGASHAQESGVQILESRAMRARRK
ncbi:MAG TPA: oxidoreductase [Thermoanaerobaculia bacterium]